MRLIFRSALVWLGLLALAFINGALREVVLKKYFGIHALLAQQLSCLTGVLLWTVFLFLMWRWLAIKRLNEAIGVGLSWLAITFFFETFILNRNLSWPEILHTYDVGAGEFWGLVLLWIGMMPVGLFILKRR